VPSFVFELYTWTDNMGRRKMKTTSQAFIEHRHEFSDLSNGSSKSSAEHYSRMEEDFDAIRLTQRVYAKESESLQGWVKRL
jgi:hypothetical protein